MDFALTEAQQDIQGLAYKILQDNVTTDDLRRYDERGVERFDGGLWQTLSDSGLTGITLDEAAGGLGFGFKELALLLEECGRVLAPVPVASTAVGAMAVQKFGKNIFDQGQYADFLRGVVAGSTIIAAAINEPLVEDPYQPVTVFTQTGPEGEGKVSGTKQCVGYYENSRYLLVVADDQGEAGLCLVDSGQDAIHSKALWSSSYEPQSYLFFDGVPSRKLGGLDAVQYFIEHYMAAVCAMQVGVCEQMVKLVSEYTSEREQFGVKIASFQAVGHRAANCYMDAKCLKLATQQAVSLLSEERPASAKVNIAKAWCGDAGHRISYSAQHLHGGMGVDRDYPLWRYCLWAKQHELMLGSSTYHLDALGDAIAAGDFDIDLP